MNFTETLQNLTGKPLADCTDQELYLALLELVRQKSADRVQPVTGRKLYYISAEFLIGKLLSNNLINLGLYKEARDALAAAGKRLSDIEEVEPEPSLGNGGLGRLAACFLDSLATLGLPGDGVGLRYHFGLFHQSFEDGVQNEKPDPWLTAHSWAEKTDVTYPVELAGKEYTARLYKLAVTGYEGRTNTLNLFDLDTIDESIVHDGIAFDKTAIDKNLTLFLYPDDSDEAGRYLRVYQQYLMVSAGAQLILAECAARGCEQAIGSTLISHETRVKNAFAKLRQNHKFNKSQLDWLKRIEKVMLEEAVLDEQMFEQGAFKNNGGFKGIDRRFEGQLHDVIVELNQYLYDDGGTVA